MNAMWSTLLGVAIGFILSMIKEHYYYRPKVVIKIVDSSIWPYGENEKWAGSQEIKDSINDANEIKVEMKIHIYNNGRQSTAIKSIGVTIKEKEEIVTTSNLQYVNRIVRGNRELSGTAFNLGPGTIEHIEVEAIFKIGEKKYEVSRNLEQINDLSTTLEVVDIEGKKYNINE